MPAATPLPLRQQLWDLHQAGLAPPRIAQQLGLPPRTVRDLLARWRQRPTPADLSPGFGRCGRRVGEPRREVQQDCRRLRRLNPGWGAGRIRLELLKLHPAGHVPPERTLQDWLRRAGLTPPPVVRPPARDDRRAREPHEVWQMDAVECLTLRDGSGACWLRLADECSGAILATEVFPPVPLVHGARRPGARGPAAGLRPLGLPAAVARG